MSTSNIYKPERKDSVAEMIEVLPLTAESWALSARYIDDFHDDTHGRLSKSSNTLQLSLRRK